MLLPCDPSGSPCGASTSFRSSVASLSRPRPHASEAERGFVALMGPGLSLLTTGAFVLLWQGTGTPLFAELALVSAVLNGINLAPVLPLDGGQIVDAILSRADPEIVAIVNFVCLLAGVGAALYLEWSCLDGTLAA